MALDLKKIEMTLSTLQNTTEIFKSIKFGETIDFAVVSEDMPEREFDFNGRKILTRFLQICLLKNEKWDNKTIFLRMTSKSVLEQILDILCNKGEVVFQLYKDHPGNQSPYGKTNVSVIRKINKKDRVHLNNLTTYKELPVQKKIETPQSDEVQVLMKRIGYDTNAHLA